jgi:alkanesulfonate monooxygenase SsuD/methylene tetrahydromethanopterin reductase-like flavin-dependent oxidoreductase (luciferase family)
MESAIKFGVIRSFSLPWPEIVEQAKRIEAAGFDHFWGIDHFVRPAHPNDPQFESWTTLAALSTLTSRIRLGLLVTSNTFRHPALLAKEAMTVDHISGGRLELGLGAGGFEPEHGPFGIHYPAPAERVERFRESVESIDLLLRQDVSSYDGRYVKLANAPFRPSAVQKPRPPLTLAAHGPKMMRIAAKYADRWNSYGPVDEMRERIAELDRACAEVGRDPKEIIRSVYARSATLEIDTWSSADVIKRMVEGFTAIGITEFVLDPPRPDQWDRFAAIAGEVLRA